MKIYGHFFSSPANQVRYAANATGEAYEYEHVDLMQEQQKTPEYLAINPLGKVPAIDDDGFTLAESNAITRYLACKKDCALYPQDARKRAVIDQWMDFASLHVRTNMGKVLFNKMFAPMFDMPVDEKSMQEGENFLNQNLAQIEQHLSTQPYLAGEALTIADIAMTAAMDPFEKIGFDIAAYPNAQKWRANAMAQDWYKNVHAHYGAEIEG